MVRRRSPRAHVPVHRVLAAVAVGLLGFIGACDAAEEETPPATQGDYQGLSRDQIEAEATPMSPEEAERLGIIDTTISTPSTMNPDSVVPLDSARVQPIQ